MNDYPLLWIIKFRHQLPDWILIYVNVFFFISAPCKCTCSPDCKRKNMIIDVLLKFFYREGYDLNCCKKGCNCPDAKFPECDEANNPPVSAYDVMTKLFKPQEGSIETGSVEVNGKKFSFERRKKLSKAFKTVVEGLDEVFNSKSN